MDRLVQTERIRTLAPRVRGGIAGRVFPQTGQGDARHEAPQHRLLHDRRPRAAANGAESEDTMTDHSTRPRLAEVRLASVWPPRPGGHCFCTMSIGQWDGTLQAAYDLGYTLLELDDEETIVRAYRTTALN
jgi:hypothetical protein